MPPKFRRPPPPQADGSGELSPQDEDSFFSRNKKGWEGVKVDNIASPRKGSRDSSDSDEMSPARKRQKGKSVKKESDWTRPGAVIVIDSDSELEALSDHGRHKSSSSPGKGKGKGKATKPVRNRSITPPPDVPQHALQEAKRVVREVLFAGQRGQDDAELNDTLMVEDDENPDVKAMQQAYNAQSPSYNPASPQDPSEEEDETLKLRVLWKGPPLAEGKAKWAFAFNLNAPFRRLNEMMQQKTLLPESEITMAHNSRRILLGATPKSLRMRKGTTETIDVYSKQQWEAEGLEPLVTPLTSPRVDDMVPAAGATQSNEADDEDNEAQDNVLILNIRSAKHPNPVTINAKPTAKSSSVLAKYLKKVGEDVAAFDIMGDSKSRGKKPVKLSFDGEELAGSAPVGSVDADDEDMWDIVGL